MTFPKVERAYFCFFCRTAAILLLALNVTECTRAASLEERLGEIMPEVIADLRAKGHKTVGVLKFSYCRGRLDLHKGGAFDATAIRAEGFDLQDSIGTINTLMARRVETALAVKNPPREAESINLVRNASHVASTISGANHLRREGRDLLFGPEYDLAWKQNGQRVRLPADVFLSGVVVDEPGKDRFMVGLVVTPRVGKQYYAAVFYADKTGVLINEAGGSYRLRGGEDVGAFEAAEAVRRNAEAFHPASPGSSSVPGQYSIGLIVRYDGRKVTSEVRQDVGEVWIQEPQEGQKVVCYLERYDDLDTPLAVVLKVNGENTLNREVLPDPSCSKWILGPGRKIYAVQGYHTRSESTTRTSSDQSNQYTLEEFRIASQSRSRELETYYGSDVGLISATVFKPLNRASSEYDDDLSDPFLDDYEDVVVIEKTEFPDETPNNASALRVQLRSTGGATSVRGGGLIVPGDVRDTELETMDEEWAPVPIGSIVYRYYHRQEPATVSPGQ